MTDSEVAEKCGVTRGMVYRWRTGQVRSIRRNNFMSVCTSLGYKVVSDGDRVDLIKSEISELKQPFTLKGENEMAVATYDEVIKNQALTIQKQWDRIETVEEEYKAEIKELKSYIRTLETDLANKPNMNLDNTRMQFIVNMETQEYVSCTQLYADLFDKNAFDIIKNAQWSHLVHPDDVWRFPIIATQTTPQQEKRNTWKLQASKLNPDKDDKESYVETITLPLDKEGVLKKVDAKQSTKEEWEKSNQWYKTFEKDPSVN